MSRFAPLVLALATGPLLTGCSTAGPAPEGHWASDGYALHLDLTGEDAVIYQATSAGCVVMGQAARVTGGSLDGVTLNGVGMLLGRMDVPMTTGPESLALDFGKLNPVRFRPVPALPASCATPLPGDPVTTFEALWVFMDEHYPFFHQRGMDWAAARARVDARVGPEMSLLDLKNVMSDMLVPLGDGHVSLYTPFGEVSAIDIPDWAEGFDQDGLLDLATQVGRLTLPEGRTSRDGSFRWGVTDDGIGYLWAAGFNEALEEGPAPEIEAIMSDLLDRMEAADSEVLVIDVRINFGGQDTLGHRIAGFLVDSSTPVGTKSVWVDGEWQPIMDLVIDPAPRTFGGEVFLLTSEMTISAAETFTLALSQVDNVTLVGSPGNGMLSDQFFALLPNGWLLSYANELYLDRDGNSYEALGVPVDHPVSMDPAALARGEDAHMALVRSLLER